MHHATFTQKLTEKPTLLKCAPFLISSAEVFFLFACLFFVIFLVAKLKQEHPLKTAASQTSQPQTYAPKPLYAHSFDQFTE